MPGFSYDLVEYPSHIHAQMHPARLAAIARLHGIDAASPAACTLLEVGCGDGLQLLTLALAYPDSRFTGVDLSHKAIERGEAMRARLGLRNLRLVHADLARWDADAPRYDYILAHGFYSWVPGFVREALLALCGRNLGPAGIAYVSYNALPGARLRRLVSDLLMFHVRDIDDPHARVAAARELLAEVDALAPGESLYAHVLRKEAAGFLERPDDVLLHHDDLAEVSEAFSVGQLAADAARHQLHYLADAEYHSAVGVVRSPQWQQRLQQLGSSDVVAREQYMDHFNGRRFRQTLLCRDAQAAMLRRRLDAIDGCAASGQPILEQVDPAPDGAAQLRVSNKQGASIVLDHPVATQAVRRLAQDYPATLPFASLLQAAAADSHGGGPSAQDADALRNALLMLFQVGLVGLQVDPPAYALRPGERPLASPLARLQLQDEDPSRLVTQRPSIAELDRSTRALLRLLDGSRDRPALARDLADALAPVDADAASHLRLRESIASNLDIALDSLARLGLLVAA